MKLLLDENLPHAFRHFIAGHDCYTAKYMGWDGLKNGRLLAAAAAEGFDAILTTDQHVAEQQNLAMLPLAIVILQTPTNALEDLRPLLGRLLDALNVLQPRSVVVVA